MLTSIRKITTSFLAKVLIVIIILPFLFWGMGDVFRGGNQNIIATIDSEKISAQVFTNYVNRLNLNKEQEKNLGRTDLLREILSDYVGKKIFAMEIKSKGINLSNRSLRAIIISDEVFFKDNKFSRTAYEKFLLKSGISATTFEKNIAEGEKQRQLLTYLSQGIVLPEILIKKEFENENQIKTIQYLDLDKLYKNIQIKDEKIQKTYESNKNLFTQEFKKINYTELLPSNLTGQDEYNETYFRKIDEIENAILDGGKMGDFRKMFNLLIIHINETNRLKKNKIGKEIEKIDNVLFAKIFSTTDVDKPELININNKYYLTEVTNIEKINRTLEDVQIKKAIISQLKMKHVIESNTDIVKKMSEGNFKKKHFDEFGKDNMIETKKITLNDTKDETVFSSGVIKEIFKVKDGELQLITNSMLTKNYIVFAEKTKKLIFNKDVKDYQKYKSRAKLRFANQIYSVFDKTMNSKYNVEINEKVLSRLKNTL